MRSRFPLLCLCLFLSACDQSQQNTASHTAALRVGVTTVQYHPLTLSTLLPGRTVSVTEAEVRPQVSGVILKRLFKEGSEVKAGQPLYQIDPATYQAAYDKAKAQLLNSRLTLNRDKTLIASDAISKQTYDSAVSDYAQAEADFRTAQVNLNYTSVRAPISGHIGRSSASVGALVSNGQSTALATITQLDPMYVDVSESSADLLRQRQALANGTLQKLNDHQTAVTLQLDDGSHYAEAGRLEFSEVQVDQDTGSVTLRAEFPNPQQVLLPGMFVQAKLSQGTVPNAVMIPQAAVLHDNKGQPYVYVVGADNKAQQQTITTGEMHDGLWQVRAGLKQNQRLIVNNLQNISEGMSVDPYTVSPTPQSDSDNAISLSMTDASAQ